MHSYSAHYYRESATGTKMGSATEYTGLTRWYQLIHEGGSSWTPSSLSSNAPFFDGFDPEPTKSDLIVDEWGAWHPRQAEGP